MMMMKTATLLLAVACMAAPLVAADFIVAPAKLAPVPYAPWANQHWVWLSNPQSNQVNVTNYIKDYLAHGIPVGGLNIDSGWSTGYNNFEWDSKKFPDPAGLVKWIHSQGVHVILWVTSMVDTDSSNYQEMKDKGYGVRAPWGAAHNLKWWHGEGLLLDYSNPEALAWWHKQMDAVLALGIDGWKTDGTDPYVLEEPGVGLAHSGLVTAQQYANWYYGDFFHHTRKVRGDSALIMSRPVDTLNIKKEVDFFRKFSPRDTVWSGWVGDQDPDFWGMRAALRNIVQSAWHGYIGYGHDIGGYRCCADTDVGPNGRSRELLLRSAQLGALLPLMENGGDNEHRPWKFEQPEETTAIYRYYVMLHHELAPYIASAATKAAATEDGTVIRPMLKKPRYNLIAWRCADIARFDYMLGDDLYVYPIAHKGVRAVDVTFPDGGDWLDFYNVANRYAGGSTHNVPAPLELMPLFVRAGALMPLNVTAPDLNHGDAHSLGATSWMIVAPLNDTRVAADSHEFQGSGSSASYTLDSSSKTLTVEMTAKDALSVLIITGIELEKPLKIVVTSGDHPEGQEMPQLMAPRTSSEQTGYQLNEAELIIFAPSASKGLRFTISSIVSPK